MYKQIMYHSPNTLILKLININKNVIYWCLVLFQSVKMKNVKELPVQLIGENSTAHTVARIHQQVVSVPALSICSCQLMDTPVRKVR